MTKLQTTQVNQLVQPPEITNIQPKTVDKLERFTKQNYRSLLAAGLSKTEASTICYGHPQHTTGTFTNTKEGPWT